MTKEDYIKQLHENEIFKAVIDNARDDKEKRFVKAFAEEFLMSFAEVLIPLQEAIEKDPEGFRKRLLESEQDIVSEGKSDPEAK